VSIEKVNPRKGVYRVRFYETGTKDGRQRQITLRGVTFDEAQRREREELAKASGRRARGETSQTLTFRELAVEYFEVKEKKMSPRSLDRAKGIVTKHLEPVFGGMRVEAIRAIDVERHQAERLKTASPSTVVREWNVLRAILYFYEKYGHPNPIGRKAVTPPKVDDEKTVFFEPEEWRRFIAAFEDRDRWREFRASVRRFGPVKIGATVNAPRRYGAGMKPDSDASDAYLDRLRELPPLFTTLLYTGGRLGEVLALRWEDVDFKRAQVTLFQEKTRKRKTVPMTKPLRAVLESLPRGTPKAHVFQRAGHPYMPAEVQRAFTVAKKIAKVRDELTPHSLRHTFASWLAIKGTPLRTIQELLGHENIRTTLRYAHLSQGHLADAVEAIEEMAGEEPDAKRG
jgi:integrase